MKQKELKLKAPLLKGSSKAVMPSLGHGNRLLDRGVENPIRAFSRRARLLQVDSEYTPTSNPLQLSLYSLRYLANIFGTSERTEPLVRMRALMGKQTQRLKQLKETIQ